MKTIRIPARPEQLDAVNRFIHGQLEPFHCPGKLLMLIDLAVEEIFVNIASYSTAAQAEVAAEVTGEPPLLTLRFSDDGVPFDPLARPDADTTLSADSRPIGGLGILLVKKTMDAVSYRYQDGRNVLTVQKRLTAEDCL